MRQQEQTKEYFQSAAADWQSKSENESGAYSVIEERNRAVLDVIQEARAQTPFLTWAVVPDSWSLKLLDWAFRRRETTLRTR